MIYDYILSTGDSSISGCASEALGTNRFAELNKKMIQGGGHTYFDQALIKGEMEIMSALNGQTLFEEPPTTGQGINEIIYQIFTGDFFVKTGAADLIERSTIFYDSLTPTKATFDIFYNKITGASFIGTGMNGGYGIGNSLGSGVSGTFPTASFSEFDFFLNGQKIYSGMGVQENAFAGATTFVPNFVDGAGIVTSENASSFKATAYLKRDRINEVTGVFPDVFGSAFIDEQTNLYVNGVKQEPTSYLELYSGVTMVKDGVSAIISDFKSDTTSKNLQL